jgi:ComF family protein
MVAGHRFAGQYIEPMTLPSRLPSVCAVCHGWGRSRICTDCLQRHAVPRTRCGLCAIRIPDGASTCGACLRNPPPFAHAVAAVDYRFPWSQLVTALKFHAALDLAPALAAALVAAVRASGRPLPVLVLPVPLSPERLAERGMNQAWELARRVAATLGLEARADVLARWVDTPHLADLPREERAACIRGAFGVAPGRQGPLRGRRVALVDDVMTSGATAAEAARALLAGGASEVAVWVIARTPAPGDA